MAKNQDNITRHLKITGDDVTAVITNAMYLGAAMLSASRDPYNRRILVVSNRQNERTLIDNWHQASRLDPFVVPDFIADTDDQSLRSLFDRIEVGDYGVLVIDTPATAEEFDLAVEASSHLSWILNQVDILVTTE